MKKRFLAIGLIGVLLLNTMPVYATTHELQQDGTADVHVYTTVVDDFSVKIPKSLELAEGLNVLPVHTKGDISLNRQIRVECDEYVTLTNEANSEFQVTLSVDNKELTWLDAELSDADYIQKESSIDFTESKLEAGDYSGTLSYDIVLEIQPVQLASTWKTYLTNAGVTLSEVKTVTFQDGYPSTLTGLTPIDVSETQDGGVLATYDTSSKALVIGSPLRIVAPTSMDGAFQGWSSLISTDFTNLDTSKTTDMGYMFCDSLSLTSIDLGNLETQNVKDFHAFLMSSNVGQMSIKSLDVSSLDTSNATDMNHMFFGCTSIRSIEGLENIDTSNVTNFSNMFGHCQNLESLIDIADWDVSNVVYFDRMFQRNYQLQELDLSNWNTSSAITMANMFNDALRNLDVANIGLNGLDTDNVESMQYMFANNAAITSLDLSSWKTPYLNDIGGIFFGCTKLAAVDMRNASFKRLVEGEVMTGSMYHNWISTHYGDYVCPAVVTVNSNSGYSKLNTVVPVNVITLE